MDPHRPGVPKNLEARLHLAWLRSELVSAFKDDSDYDENLCTNTEVGRRLLEVSPSACRSTSLPPGLQRPEMDTLLTENDVIGPACRQSAENEEMVFDMFEEPDPGDSMVDRLDVDEDTFLDGLDELSEAFRELEELLPDPPAVLPGPSDTLTDVTPSKRQGNVIELLVGAARAIFEGDTPGALSLLDKLHEVASIHGDASQRLSAYFLEGLTARMAGKMPKDHRALVQPNDDLAPDCGHHVLKAFQVLLSSSPFLTFGQVAVNCALLETFLGAEKVHIVDFGIGHGLQWPPLLQALASRPQGPPHVRITGIDLPAHGAKRAYCVVETGIKLKMIASSLHIPFQYDAIASRLENVTAQRIDIRGDEVLAVNCALRLSQILDGSASPPSDPRTMLLQSVRELNPAVFTLVEQHTNHNSPFFLSRFYEALYYYASLFDSMDASVPAGDQSARRIFEQHVLGKAIVNLLACEGQNRVERQESLDRWQARIQRCGFLPRELSENMKNVATDLLKLYTAGYGLYMQDPGSLSLTWQTVPLLDVTVWIPA